MADPLKFNTFRNPVDDLMARTTKMLILYGQVFFKILVISELLWSINIKKDIQRR